MAKRIKNFIFTPSHFFHYATCPQWIWFDIFGDSSKKKEASDFQIRLREQGVLHEEDYVKGLRFTNIEAVYPQEALRETLKSMKRGDPLIYQGLLETRIDGIVYRGRPDLLEKRDGKSSLGDWYYIPIDIKNSNEIKEKYLFQLVLYSMLLESIQGVFPTEVNIINRDKQRMPHMVTETDMVKTKQKIEAILSIVNGNRPPFTLTSSCQRDNPWADECLKEVETRNDIALIYKLDSRAIEGLRANGINTVKDLAEVDIDSLPKISYAKPETLKFKQLQAQCLLSKKVLRRSEVSIPDASVKLYFDIEGDPFIGVEYLFGFWVVEEGKKPYYKYFLAEKPEDEGKMWGEFLSWIRSLPDGYRVYHYHIYEMTKLKQLAERYSIIPELEKFKGQMIDLAKVVQDSVIFPLYFYSIKDIAKHLNFAWRSAKAGGAQSIMWYEEWLEKGNKQILEDLIGYNEDDVRATEVLHQWLIKK